MIIVRYSVALLLGVLLAACGLLPDQIDETKGWSAQKLYNEAKDNLSNHNYEEAVKKIEFRLTSK